MIRFPLKTAYAFLEAHGLSTEARRIRVTPDRFGVLRIAIVLDLLRCKALLDTFVADWWPKGSSSEGRRHTSTLVRIYSRYNESKKLTQNVDMVIVESHRIAA
jgi:hypothetical protein